MIKKILYYGGCAFVLVLFELTVINFIPLGGSVDILFISVLLLIMDHQPIPAALLGSVGSIARDILSITMFGTHLIVFILIFMLLLILSQIVFTSKAYIAYLIFGLLMCALNILLYEVVVALFSSPHGLIPLITMFPSFGVRMIASGIFLAIFVSIHLNKSSVSVRPFIYRSV